MADLDLLKNLLSADAPSEMGTNFTKTIHATPNAANDPANVSLPEGYTVLVIGAGKGIGEFIAKAYAQAKATNIIITSRTQKDLERVKQDLEQLTESHKSRVSIYAGDASDPSSYEKLADLVTSKYNGRLDCLVCNAGGGDGGAVDPTARLHQSDPHEYTHNTTLNYLGPYYAARYLIPLMLNPQSVGKTIINITSGACHLAELPPLWYNTAKLALNRLTQGIASQYSPEGFVAVAMHPGGVITDGAMRNAPHMKDYLTDDIRLCGAACVWLSSVRPAWMSGRYMDCKWDVDELTAKKDEIVKGDKLKSKMVV